MAIEVWAANQPSGGPTYSAETLRSLMAMEWAASSTRPLGSSSGIHPATATTAATATSSPLQVVLHAQKGLFDAEAGAGSGAYKYRITADITQALNARDGTNDRIDLLSLQINDPDEGDGSGTFSATIVYTAGTAASSPVAPSPPNSRCMPLINVRVPHTATTPTVTWVAPFAVAAGGVQPCRTSSEYPASPYVGQYVDDATLGLLRWDGSQWRKYGGTGDSGWQAITALTGYTSVAAFARKLGSQVTLRGAIQKNGGVQFPTTYTNCATLPAGFAPVNFMRVSAPAFASGSSNGLLAQFNAASLTIQGASDGAGADVLYLDGITYFID